MGSEEGEVKRQEERQWSIMSQKFLNGEEKMICIDLHCGHFLKDASKDFLIFGTTFQLPCPF